MKSRIGLLGLMFAGLVFVDTEQINYHTPKINLNHNFGKTGGGSPSKHGISLKQHRKNRKNSKLAKLARRKQR